MCTQGRWEPALCPESNSALSAITGDAFAELRSKAGILMHNSLATSEVKYYYISPLVLFLL